MDCKVEIQTYLITKNKLILDLEYFWFQLQFQQFLLKAEKKKLWNMEIQTEKIKTLLFKNQKVFNLNELRKKVKCTIVMEKYLLVKLSSVEIEFPID